VEWYGKEDRQPIALCPLPDVAPGSELLSARGNGGADARRNRGSGDKGPPGRHPVLRRDKLPDREQSLEYKDLGLS
jgi:hypothetical protein